MAERGVSKSAGALASENARLIESEMHAARTAQTLSQVNEILLSALTLDDVVARLVGEASQAAGAEKALVVRVDGDTYTVTNVRGLRARGLVGVAKDAAYYPAFHMAAQLRRPVLIGDTWTDDRTNKDFVVPNGLRAFELLPLIVDDAVTHVLALAWSEPREFDQDDLQSAERMAAGMSAALANAELYEAEKLARSQLRSELEFSQVLLNATSVLSEWTDIDRMLDRLADVLLRNMGHTRVTISLWDATRCVMANVVSKGEAPMAGTETSLEDMSPAGRRMMRTKRTVRIDYSKSKNADLKRVAAERHLRYALAVPVVARGRVTGSITVDAPNGRREFSDREIAVVEAVASHAAAAIENARLFDAERRGRIRSDLLRVIADAASRSLDARKISRQVLDILGSDREMVAGVVYALSESGVSPTLKALTVVADTPGLSDLLTELPLADKDNPSRLVLTDLELLTSEEPGAWTGADARLAALGLPDVRWVVLPIRAEGRLLGVLGLIYRGHRSFEATEIRLYDGVAATLGPLLRNAQLYAEITANSQRLDAHINNSPLAVVEFDPEFRIVRWSEEAARVFGWSADEVLGRAIGEFKWVVEDDMGLVDDESGRLAAGTGRSYNLNRNYRKDGSIIWCEWYDSAIYDADGNLVSVFSQVLDVTKRRAAEEALRRSEGRYRLLFANMLDGFAYCKMIFDDLERPIDFVYIDVNDSFEHLTGLKGVVGKAVSEVIPGIAATNPELLETYGQVVATGEPAHFETDLDALGMSLSITVYRPQEGHFVAIFDNITESKRAEAERAERERLNGALAEIGTAVSTTLDADEILGALLDASARALGVDTAGLSLRQGLHWDMTEYYGSGKRRPVSALTDTALERAVLDSADGQPVVINDTGSDPRVDRERMKRLGIRSLMALPIVVQSQVVAVMIYHHRREARAFSRSQIGFAARLAAVVALALENARLFKTERDIADRLQEALLLLPPEVPGIEFAHAYNSATEAARVGGDFYDLFELDDRHVGVTIGDVAGKGIDAAVLTSLARHTIRAYATEMHHSPGRVLALANEVVFKATPVESFLTVFYGVLDRADGSLVYASASHTTGGIARPDGKVVRLGATGTLLGAFPGMTFDERTVSMDAGSLLFLYTDGLTEARRDGELYGEERVFAHLATKTVGSAETVVRGVVADVREFSGDRLRDDLAILALRLVPEGSHCGDSVPAPKAATKPAAKRQGKPKPRPAS
jgi:PAS domain S-box-containing protein